MVFTIYPVIYFQMKDLSQKASNAYTAFIYIFSLGMIDCISNSNYRNSMSKNTDF